MAIAKSNIDIAISFIFLVTEFACLNISVRPANPFAKSARPPNNRPNCNV